MPYDFIPQPAWRWMRSSVLSPCVEHYTHDLINRGYAIRTIEAYLRSVAHFAYWLTQQCLALTCIDEALIHRFLTVHLPTCDCPRPCRRRLYDSRAALRHLLHGLRQTGQIPPKSPPSLTEIGTEISRFDEYLREVCGLASSTRVYRRRYVSALLRVYFRDRPIELARLSPNDILRFITQRAEGCKPGTAQVIGVSVRSYLRFRAFNGDDTKRLIAAVPTVAQWRLSALPDRLSEEELKCLLNAFDRNSATGRRDYAIARCLIDLGLRAHEVAQLQLDDINWREGTLRIRSGKGGRVDALPLPTETGRAIVEYLRSGRPDTPHRTVFVRHIAPLDRPITPTIVRNAIRYAFARCGWADRWTGTHVLRHTAASRMLQSGATLKDIADVLRHRSLDTTVIYTKIDLQTLTTVALPWPGSAS